MKSVLMIPYFFPPEGSAGVYRPLRFVRQLSNMGWNASVVSADPYHYERYDPKLLDLVPETVEVIRIRPSDLWQKFQSWRGNRLQKKIAGEPLEKVAGLRERHMAPGRSRLRAAIRMVESYYYLPDLWSPWIRPAVRASCKVCSRKNPSIIWATIGPVSSGVVAQKTSERTGIPYVLDFRDPWGLLYYESELRRSKKITQLGYRNMYALLERAQAVIFLFPRMAECYWQAYQGALNSEKIHIIPNGYEGKIEPFHISDSTKCTIMYTGTLSTYRYDTLLQGIKILKNEESHLAKCLKLFFVGDAMEDLVREADALGISDIIETSPPVTYSEILQLQQNAHAFLILGRKQERKGHELVAGAKLFAYFKARRPIFGVLPNDETRRILDDVGVPTIANGDSISEIIDVLKLILTTWKDGTLETLLPKSEICENYSIQNQTQALIRALEGLPAMQPFVPGMVDVPPSLREDITAGNFMY